MFFILSKTLNYLIQPLVIILLCFLLSMILKSPRWKKRLLVAGFTFFLFFSNDFLANEVMRMWEPDATAYHDIRKTYALGILLTGVSISGKEPADRVYFQRGVERVTHTVELYKLGKIGGVLVTGGSGRLLNTDQKEAEDIKRALVMMGVNEVDVMVENASRNTHESAVEVKKMLDRMSRSYSDCLLITSAFHMPRTAASFRKAGMEMDTFTTDSHTHPRTFTPDALFIPKIESFVIWHKLTREWVGFVAYKLVGYV